MAKGFKRAPARKADDTSVQGHAKTSYAKLVSVFGKPNKGDGKKVDAEWCLEFTNGTIATIYNYKDGKAYLGKKGKPVSRIMDWHIGGRSKAAAALVLAALR